MKGNTTLIAILLSLGISSAAIAANDNAGGSSDTMLKAKIVGSYALNKDLKSSGIETTVENGVVRLVGTVPTQTEKDMAAQIAQNTDGVVRVENDITVGKVDNKGKIAKTVTDTAITASVKSKFLVAKNLTSKDISVTTNHGVVVLKGYVPTAREKLQAEDIAMHVDGVSKVNNLLIVEADEGSK